MRMRVCVSLVVLATLASVGTVAAQDRVDVLVRNGKILDGTGNPWYSADLAIKGDRIVAMGNLGSLQADRVIDATGLLVTPGFIDVHSHAGEGLATAELSHGIPLLAQGLSTVFVNPDGGGPVDIAKQRQDLLAHGLGVNVVQFAPHNSIREAVLGMQDRAPDAEELKRMQDLVRKGMEDGAFGLSTGLYYAPGSYSKTEEVIALAKVAAEFGGSYTSHIRDEADYSVGVVAAVDEVIRISREARLPAVSSHIKVLGPRVWGYSLALVRRIEKAREEGLEVFADQYPYEASGTGIVGALIPRWAQVGGRQALLKRIDDPKERERLVADMLENLDRRGGADRLQFRRYEADPSIEGRTLGAVARERGMQPVDLALEILKKGDPGFVSFNMHPDDLALLMRQPWVMTCTDGDLVPMGEGVPHPRAYGSFPRKIRKYVLEDKVVSLENAIRSMTSLPATVFRIKDRGVLREGAIADVIVMDLETVRDKATYQEPHQLSEGIQYMLVNGKLAIDGAEFQPARAGQVLRLNSGK